MDRETVINKARELVAVLSEEITQDKGSVIYFEAENRRVILNVILVPKAAPSWAPQDWAPMITAGPAGNTCPRCNGTGVV